MLLCALCSQAGWLTIIFDRYVQHRAAHATVRSAGLASHQASFGLQLSQQDERRLMQELAADAEQFTAW